MKQAMTGTNDVKGSRAAKVGALMLTGIISLAPAAAMAEFSGNIGVSSNYVFRGVSLGDPAVSGGLDYAHESGFYAGTWLSNISGGDVETDLYAGFGGEIGSGFSYDVGYLYYAYPWEGCTDCDYGEIYGSVSWEFVSAGVAYTVNSKVDETAAGTDLFIPGDIYYYIGASFPLQDGWSIGGTVGYYDFDEDGVNDVEASYLHGQVDLTKSTDDLGDFTFSLSMTDETDVSDGDLIPFVSWGKSF